MQNDISILRPQPPKFNINQTVFSRISATKGYIEPLYIHDVQFDTSVRQWLYTFRRDLDIIPTAEYKYGQLTNNAPIPSAKAPILIPAKLHENKLLTFCEALGIQLSFLQRELDSAVKLLDTRCPSTVPVPLPVTQRVYPDNKYQVAMPRPRYGVNDVVYLIDSAKSVGRLEPIRISDIKWDNSSNQWLYVIDFNPRPEFTMTIGDKDNWRRRYTVVYRENELANFCETQTEVVSFLTKAVDLAKRRQSSLCVTTGSTFD